MKTVARFILRTTALLSAVSRVPSRCSEFLPKQATTTPPQNILETLRTFLTFEFICIANNQKKATDGSLPVDRF
jgi:hypothetical protein